MLLSLSIASPALPSSFPRRWSRGCRETVIRRMIRSRTVAHGQHAGVVVLATSQGSDRQGTARA